MNFQSLIADLENYASESGQLAYLHAIALVQRASGVAHEWLALPDDDAECDVDLDAIVELRAEDDSTAINYAVDMFCNESFTEYRVVWTPPEWIIWSGGDMPVNENANVEFRYANGYQGKTFASSLPWQDDVEHGVASIVAYRQVRHD